MHYTKICANGTYSTTIQIDNKKARFVGYPSISDLVAARERFKRATRPKNTDMPMSEAVKAVHIVANRLTI